MVLIFILLYMHCKICWEGKTKLYDPLLSPCFCKGSLQKIHLRCLLQCLKKNNKCTICLFQFYPQRENILVFFSYIIFCEVCYIDLIKYDTVLYNLILVYISYIKKKKYIIIYFLRILILIYLHDLYNINKLHFYLVFFHLYKIINDYYYNIRT